MNHAAPRNEGLFQQVLHGIDHGAFDDPLGQSLVRAYRCDAADELVLGLMRNRLHQLQTQQALGQLPPFKVARLRQGELELGKDIHGPLVLLLLQWLVAGMLVASNTGGGKSALLCYLVPQIAALARAVWICEAYKQQLRRLRRLLRRMGIELIILRPSDWRWNLLESHLRDPRTHLTMAVDLLMRLLDLPPRARTILNQAAHELYRKFGIWNGNTKSWPTLFDLYEWVWTQRDLNTQAQEAILDRLGSLLVGLTPRCAAWRRAWDPAELARWSIDFEMKGASEIVKQFLLEPTLFSVFQREVERGVVNGPLRLFIAFDDSQRFFDAGGQITDGALTPMDELAGIIRGTGIGLCVMVQTMQGLSRRLLPNLATKLIGRLGSAADYAGLGADLGLTVDQVEWAKLHLQPGTFVGQVAEGDWREPFVFTVPLVSLSEPVDDDEAAESVKALDSLPTEPAVEFAKWEPHHLVTVSTASAPIGLKLTEAEIRFLKAVIQHPGKPSSLYAKLAGVGGRQAITIRERLVQAGYLEEHQIATGQRGRQAIVLEPMGPAFDAVAQTRTV